MAFTIESPRGYCQQLAARSRARRLALNLGQRELAERAGLSFGTVRRFESGAPISLENFIRILEVLGAADDLRKVLEEGPGLTIERLERLEKGRERKRAGRRKT